jgi:hypothetical protein
MSNIILTTTVNTKLNKEYVHQTNPEERVETYLKSIRQWLTKTNFNIIVVENSGYIFEELDEEKDKYRNRFEFICFNEDDLEEADYLIGNSSKGASEMFAIHYAFHNSTIIQSNHFFIIKITGRYFIPDFEEYINQYNLQEYDCLRQNDSSMCEIVGSNFNTFADIFSLHLLTESNEYYGHVEDVWKYRISKCNNVFVLRTFFIEPTRRGGWDGFCYCL